MPREGRYTKSGTDKVKIRSKMTAPNTPRKQATKNRGIAQAKRAATKRYANPDSGIYYFPNPKSNPKPQSKKRRSV